MSTNNNTDKVYVNELWFEEKTFPDGGSILKVNAKDVNALIKFIKDNKNSDGSIKFVISKKRKIEEGKSTHYAYLDTWQPTNKSATTVKTTTKVVEQEVEEEEKEQLI